VATDVPTLETPTNQKISPADFTIVLNDIHTDMKAILADLHAYSDGSAASTLATDLFNEVTLIGTALNQFDT